MYVWLTTGGKLDMGELSDEQLEKVKDFMNYILDKVIT